MTTCDGGMTFLGLIRFPKSGIRWQLIYGMPVHIFCELPDASKRIQTDFISFLRNARVKYV